MVCSLAGKVVRFGVKKRKKDFLNLLTGPTVLLIFSDLSNSSTVLGFLDPAVPLRLYTVTDCDCD